VRAARLGAWIVLLAGLAAIGYAGLQGDLEVYLLVFVPVVAGTGPWAALGLVGVIVGLAGLFWTTASSRMTRPGEGSPREPGRARQRPEQAERETKSGGVILLGPIPIAWGSDRSSLGWILVAAIVLTVAAIALTLLSIP
jgi:uncharacterized protein (TIGR00304 family)